MVKTQNPKLIARNGAYLFVRLLLVLFLSFYITRLALGYLGDEDFGINNVVGGITAIFAMISMPLTNSIQRYFNVEFSRDNFESSVVFNTCRRVILILAIVMLLLFETIGLYLINNVINLPVGRDFEANIVYQMSVLTSVFTLLALPYQALLFAKENMKVGAYSDICLSIFRLCSLLILPQLLFNHLISYSLILVVGYLALLIFYKYYCKRIYPSILERSSKDGELLRNVLSFSGWNFLESIAGISTTYGTSIIINIFGGVLYNTAYGISKQLQNAVNSFTFNLMKAVEPQITSSHTQGNFAYRDNLVLKSATASCLLVGFICVLFHFKGELILSLWLGTVPKYTTEVVTITLLNTVFTSLVLPFRCLILASGEVKRYFVLLLSLSLGVLIIMYTTLQLGSPIIVGFILLLVLEILKSLLCLIILKKSIGFNARGMLYKLTTCSGSIAVMFIVALLITKCINNSLADLFLILVLDIILLILSIAIISFNKEERIIIKNKICLWIKK